MITLVPHDKEAGLEPKTIGFMWWHLILEKCNGVFPLYFEPNGIRWVHANVDLCDKSYQSIMYNDGFNVSEYEAQMMSRMLENFVNVYRGVNPEWDWPRPAGAVFLDLCEELSEWFFHCGGFTVD